MKKNLTLVGFGFVPLLVGYGINILLGSAEMSAPAWSALELLMLPLWFFTGYRLQSEGESPLINTVFLHIPAAAAFILVSVQLLIVKRWWGVFLGAVTQSFFVPFFLPAATAGVLLTGGGLWTLFALSFAIMFALAWLGAIFKKVKMKKSKCQ